MKAKYTLDDVVIKTPTSFKKEHYNVTNLQRTASGKMCGDLIAKKVKFFFTYDVIASDELQVIMDLIWNTNKLFFWLEYIEDNETKYAEVYAGDIPKELFRTGSKWIYKNFTFDLIER